MATLRRPTLVIWSLVGLAIPSAAFWIERVLEGRLQYLRDPGPVGAIIAVLSPPLVVVPILCVIQLIVLTQGWSELSFRQRLTGLVLVAIPAAALLLPLLLGLAFRP